MLLHVQTKVFPFLKEFEGGSKFTHAMANAVFIMPKPSLLVEAINIIELIFTEIEKMLPKVDKRFRIYKAMCMKCYWVLLQVPEKTDSLEHHATLLN